MMIIGYAIIAVPTGMIGVEMIRKAHRLEAFPHKPAQPVAETAMTRTRATASTAETPCKFPRILWPVC